DGAAVDDRGDAARLALALAAVDEAGGVVRIRCVLVEAQGRGGVAGLRVAQARDLDRGDELLRAITGKRVLTVRLQGAGGPGVCRVGGEAQLGEHDRSGVVRRIRAGERGVAVVAGAERLLLDAEVGGAPLAVGAIVAADASALLVRRDGDRM